MGTPNERTKIRMAKDQQGRCFYCSLQLREDMTWEHLIARARGGSDKVSNLRVSHAACNSLVGVLPYRIKLALHDIGWTLGSDAFFLLASRLKPVANGPQNFVDRSRRPKKPKDEIHRKTIIQLVRQLPEEMLPEDLGLAA